MVHALISGGYSFGVDLVPRQLGDVVQLDKVRIPSNVILILEGIFSCGVERCADGLGVCKGRRPSKLPTRSRVLVKLSHKQI